MVRIIHFLYNNMVKQGGIESFIMNVYRNIDRQKVQFDFLSLERADVETYETEISQLGGKMYVLNVKRCNICGVRRAIKDFFDEHNEYLIVHLHMSSLYYIEELIAMKEAGVPIRIVHAHNSKQLGSKALKLLHNFNKTRIESYATHYFACSQLAAEFMYPNSIVNSKKYEIINNGINSKKFSFDIMKRNEIRKNLNLEDAFVVGMVGRMAPQKNQLFLVDIFSEIVNIRPYSKLLLVGTGPQLMTVKEKVQKENLQDKVIFAGMRTDVPDLLSAMDVYVHPALFEGLPLTLIEAQASGLPCVVSKENITIEAKLTDSYIRKSLNDTPKNWAECICSLEYNLDRTNKDYLIAKAGFDSKSVAQKLQDIYINI